MKVTKQCDCCEDDILFDDLVFADDDDKKFKKYFKEDEFKVCHWCINERKNATEKGNSKYG